jgi:hypothetical protein
MALYVRGAAISVRTWCRIGRPAPRRVHHDHPRSCSAFTTDQPPQLIGPQRAIRKFRDGWQFAKVQPASQLPLRHCRPLKSRLERAMRAISARTTVIDTLGPWSDFIKEFGFVLPKPSKRIQSVTKMQMRAQESRSAPFGGVT